MLLLLLLRICCLSLDSVASKRPNTDVVHAP
jgi:hypothetical protein